MGVAGNESLKSNSLAASIISYVFAGDSARNTHSRYTCYHAKLPNGHRLQLHQDNVELLKQLVAVML